MKKLFSLLLVLVMVLGLCAPAFAAEEPETVYILHTNDAHTNIDKELNYTLIAQYKNSLDNALLVDAGDAIQGTPYGSMNEDNGEHVVELMNLAGYDVATLGNHEFDYGMEGTMNAIEWAEYPYVSCNFYHEENGVKGENVLDSYKVFEIGGRKIAFVGFTTPESFTKSTPAYFQDDAGNYIYGIAGGDDGADLYAAAQEAIDAAMLEADIVIGLGHLGVDESSGPWTSKAVIENTYGLNAFIDGHSHSEVVAEEVTDAEGNTVILAQTGATLNNLGQVTIAPDGTITAELVTPRELKARLYDAGQSALDVEPTLAEANEGWVDQVTEEMGQVIGTFDDVLDNYDADGNRLVRSQETNSGDFVADALYYLFHDGPYAVEGYPTDIAIVNGGGVRNATMTGEVSYLDCMTMQPFGNDICLVQLSGQQILDMLEHSVRFVGSGQENGGFMQVSGMTFTVDTSIESSVETDDKNVFQGIGDTRRVKDVKVLSYETGEYEPIDPDAMYNVAGSNYFLRNQGDGYNMFEGSVNVVDNVTKDYLVLVEYIKSFPDTDGDGLPNVSGYEDVNGQGRITIE